MPLRIVFFGTAELACASLKALATHPEFKVLAVVTQPDKPKGRNLRLQPSTVKVTAAELGIPVLQPTKAREESFLQQVKELTSDLMVVVAYGQILPQSLLDISPHGCLNVHTSILPKFRGAAPIQWAILSGESETGVTIMKMDAGLDTGPIIAVKKTTIAPEDNAQTLHDRLAIIGAELLVEAIPQFVRGEIEPRGQPSDGASYARKISREDGLIDWNEPAKTIWNQVRGLTPWPGAFTFLKEGEKKTMLKIWEAAPGVENTGENPGMIMEAGKNGLMVSTGKGSLVIRVLQPEARKKMSAQEFLAGHPLNAGMGFSN